MVHTRADAAYSVYDQLLNYIDRGAIGSNGVNGTLGTSTCSGEDECFEDRGIQGDFSLSNFQDGLLASAFMLGLLISSPIFAELSEDNHMRLIGVGLSVWTAATLGCGLSLGFWSRACPSFDSDNEDSSVVSVMNSRDDFHGGDVKIEASILLSVLLYSE
ncbi:hypothetical protein R1sor_006445 [Riccia sorocarpa]|uniref:Uncharacterized protein n=1 Tax=Riccia sorocarpa TaxID=122646 RepID=A0ABD3HTW3_9MARC